MGIKQKIGEIKDRTLKSKTLLGLLMLTIGITGTICYYEGKPLYLYIREGLQIAETGLNTRTVYAYQGEAVQAASYQAEEKTVATPNEGQAHSETTPLVSLIQKEFGDDWKVAYAIAQAESSMNPAVIGDKHLSKPSVGLFQISQIYHNYTTEQLQDPEFNVKVAKKIYDNGGFERWTTYREGTYKKFM